MPVIWFFFLLYASQNSTASIKQMLCAADLLSISHNSLRVAVARLNQENIIQAVERGVYQLLEKKFDTSFISLNKHPNMQMATAWNGKYVLVYTGALGRVDRTALSKREKTLGYYGFQEMEQNVFIRPDNLMLSLTELKTAAIQFGLDPDARLRSWPARAPRRRSARRQSPSRVLRPSGQAAVPACPGLSYRYSA